MWKKIANLYCPNGDSEWLCSHASTPFAVSGGGSKFKVFFTSRDQRNRSNINHLILDMSDLSVSEICPQPLVVPGDAGAFDDSGCAMAWYLETDEKKLIYYLGWNLKVTVPFLNTIGLAVYNKKSGEFEKISRAPILDRSHEDPFCLSYPAVLKFGGRYKMWYGSNLAWGEKREDMRHVIKTAFSDDGISWTRTGKIEVNLIYPNEYAVSKPVVMRNDDGSYEMWYCYRARNRIKTYRIGYAASEDGETWTRRDDEAGIDVSKSGWDSEMICYPFVFDYDGERFMLYNGNGYGKTGFGIAILEK